MTIISSIPIGALMLLVIIPGFAAGCVAYLMHHFHKVWSLFLFTRCVLTSVTISSVITIILGSIPLGIVIRPDTDPLLYISLSGYCFLASVFAAVFFRKLFSGLSERAHIFP